MWTPLDSLSVEFHWFVCKVDMYILYIHVKADRYACNSYSQGFPPSTVIFLLGKDKL